MLAVALMGLALIAGEVRIERARPMSFGAVVVQDKGSMTVPPMGVTQRRDGVHPIRGNAEGAMFNIYGAPHEAVEISLPSRVEISSPAARGVLTDFDIAVRSTRDFTKVADGVYHIRMDAGGQNTIYVGGRLDIARTAGGGDFSADVWVSARSLDEGAGR